MMAGKPWTPERKAAHAAAMKARWAAGAYARRRLPLIEESERNARRARMKRLNIRMRDDEDMKGRCVAGMKRVRRSAAYREIQAAVMAETMSRPELRRQARFHCIRINRNPKVRRRQWASRRKRKRSAGDGT
jgi:hypothetical protein